MVLLLLLLLLVVLLAMLLAISSPAKAGGISRRLINTWNERDKRKARASERARERASHSAQKGHMLPFHTLSHSPRHCSRPFTWKRSSTSWVVLTLCPHEFSLAFASWKSYYPHHHKHQKKTGLLCSHGIHSWSEPHSYCPLILQQRPSSMKGTASTGRSRHYQRSPEGQTALSWVRGIPEVSMEDENRLIGFFSSWMKHSS